MAGKGAKRRARLRRQQALRAPRLAGEGNGDGSSGSSSYQTVEFFFHSQLKRIVCYGSEGQPSVITSIYNYCALVFMTFTPSQIPQYTEEDLIDLLNHLLDLTLESLLKDGDYAVEQVKGQMAMAKHYINSTKADPSINLDPYPFSMDSFENCDFVIFCKALGIRLLHGWVLDHKEHDILCTPDLENTLTYGILQMLFVTCDFSDSDSSAKKGKIMEDLLKEAEKRCTSNGYLSLSGMANGSFALYYWNKKLDVIHKNETYLLILETDEGVLDSLPGVTWRVFEEVDDGNSIYLASDYSLVHNQPNIEKAQQWYSDNHGYSIEPAAGKQSDFEEDQAAVQAGRELSEEDAGMELSEEDAGRELSEEDAVRELSEEDAGRELSEEDAGRELSEVEEAGREAAEEDAGRELLEVEEAGREAAEEAEIEEFSAICNDFECFLHL